MSTDYYELSKPCHGARLVCAVRTLVGQEVCFRNPAFNYVIEEIETVEPNFIRHRHDEGMATSTYHPGELLWIRHPVL